MAHNPWTSLIVAVALAAGSAVVAAAGGGGGSSGADDDTLHSTPEYVAGITAINDRRWDDATKALERHIRLHYRDADAQNWLAYANRKAGRLDKAFEHYKLALAFDPRHLGAHEYIGEAYLQIGQVAEARKYLERLAALCGTQCEQYRDLAAAIERAPTVSSR